MKEACELLNPEFLINVTINDEGNLAGFLRYHWYDAWFKGTQWVKIILCSVESKADIIIASCGGYPKTLTFIRPVNPF
jgi:nickel-dependent lactate racemase